MSVIHKSKRILRSTYDNVTSRNLKLANGTYMTKYAVPHSSERCGRKEFGAKNEEEYNYWWQEACGIDSLRMITEAIKPTQGSLPTLFEQIQQAIQENAYLQYEKDDQIVRVGWIHDKLIEIANKKQIHGYSANLSANAICKAITINKLVIASIYRPFARFIDENAERKKRGGHLVVIKGFEWNNGQCTGLFVNDPYDLEERLESVDASLFTDIYSGSAITFFAKN